MLQVHATLEIGQDEETNTYTRVSTEVLFARYREETQQRERVSHLYSPQAPNRAEIEVDLVRGAFKECDFVSLQLNAICSFPTQNWKNC